MLSGRCLEIGHRLARPPGRCVRDAADQTRQRFEEEGADLVVFTSSSTARNFFALKLTLPKGLQFASIGPVTTGTLSEFKVKPLIEAKTHDINGLVEAILSAPRA